MIITIGETLFDEFPERHRPGGAPFNFACHIKRFGLDTTLISRVGDDGAGREILTRMAGIGLDTGSVQIDPVHPTGRVRVTLDASGQAHFEILPDMAYDHIAMDDPVQRLMEADVHLIYYGTLAQRTAAARRRIQDLLQCRPARTASFCDINLRPGQYTPAVVQSCLEQADILKLSDEELAVAAAIFDLAGPLQGQVETLMARFRIETVAVTCGQQGAAIYRGGQCHRCRSRIPGRLQDTVGAGDAFSAVLAAGIRLGWPTARILDRAILFAGRICTVNGAVPDELSLYRGIVR